MRQSLLEILRGSFLVQQGALRNWRLIIFFFFLAGIMIASSHNIDQKGFNAVQALSKRNDDPKTASRPFDLDRDGFVLGEGGGCLRRI